MIDFGELSISNTAGQRIANLESPQSDAVKKTANKLSKVLTEHPELRDQVVKATIGVIKPTGEDKGLIGNPPEWLKEAREVRQKIVETLEPGYNFVGLPEYLNAVLAQLFPDIDPDTVAAIAAEGGTAANAKVNYFLNNIGAEGVSSGAPIWPGNGGAVQRIGRMPLCLYQYLDENGDWNFEEGFIKGLEGDNIIPMLHGICQNPLGLDIPEKYWGDIVEVLKHYDIPLTIDLAYLGFGNGVEEDLKMLRFFQSNKLKMFICFSDSKYLQQYGEERVGAILGVNFDNHDVIQDTLVQHSREITSARASAGQRLGAIVRTVPEIKTKHEKWQKAVRAIFERNRRIILEGVSRQQQELFKDSQGMFLAVLGKTRDDAMKIMAYAFPELAAAYFEKDTMPQDSKNFPPELRRVAVVPIEPENNAGVSGARIGLSMSEKDAEATRATLKHVFERIA